MIDRVAGLSRRRKNGQSGFTLIELLVVIIILGILAAVVVFSVSGINDNGEEAAAQIDVRTLRTAEEAHFAQYGTYATEADLVSGGFLNEESSLHNVVLGAGGTSYAITCADTEPCSTMKVGAEQDLYFLVPTASGSSVQAANLGMSPTNANIFEGLIRMSPTYDLIPVLALSWTAIPSAGRVDASSAPLPNPFPGVNNTWRFVLRPGVTFHNGAPMDAQAVKEGLFDRLANVGGGTIRSGLCSGPAPCATYTSSAQVVDNTCTTTSNCVIDFTPRVENLRVPEQIVHPTNGVVAPGTVAGTTGSSFEAVGTGPFSFVSYTQGSELKVTRNESYWGSKALLKGIDFLFYPDNTVRKQALEAGDIDFAFGILKTDVAGLTSGGFTASQSPVGAYQALLANIHPDPNYVPSNPADCSTAPGGECHDLLTDINIRKAISHAIDRDDLVDVNHSGLATTDQTFVPPTALAPYQSTITGYSFNLATANSLLDASGWTGPTDGPDNARTRADGRVLELTLVTGFPSAAANDPVDTYIKGVLANVGIRINIYRASGSAGNPLSYSNRMASGQGDLYLDLGNQNDANPAFLPGLLYYTGTGAPLTLGNYAIRFAPDPVGASPQGACCVFNDSIFSTFTASTLDPVRQAVATAIHDMVDTKAIKIVLAGIPRVYMMDPSVQGFLPPPAFIHTFWGSVAKTA